MGEVLESCVFGQQCLVCSVHDSPIFLWDHSKQDTSFPFCSSPSIYYTLWKKQMCSLPVLLCLLLHYEEICY